MWCLLRRGAGRDRVAVDLVRVLWPLARPWRAARRLRVERCPGGSLVKTSAVYVAPSMLPPAAHGVRQRGWCWVTLPNGLVTRCIPHRRVPAGGIALNRLQRAQCGVGIGDGVAAALTAHAPAPAAQPLSHVVFDICPLPPAAPRPPKADAERAARALRDGVTLVSVLSGTPVVEGQRMLWSGATGERFLLRVAEAGGSSPCSLADDRLFHDCMEDSVIDHDEDYTIGMICDDTEVSVREVAQTQRQWERWLEV